jgi:transposase-like protein
MRTRRQFTPEFKARVVLDVLTGVQSQAETCRKHGLGPNLLALWKAAFLERAHLAGIPMPLLRANRIVYYTSGFPGLSASET